MGRLRTTSRGYKAFKWEEGYSLRSTVLGACMGFMTREDLLDPSPESTIYNALVEGTIDELLDEGLLEEAEE